MRFTVDRIDHVVLNVRDVEIAACASTYNDADRKAHYQNLVALDGRIVLAGEHASKITAWQEGAVLSSLDAIGRLHKRAVQG